MAKALIGVLVLLSGVLGVQTFSTQRDALHKAQAATAALKAAQLSQPAALLAFKLDQPNGKQLSTSDLCGSEVVLLYLYSDAQRSAQTEETLADVLKQNPGKVKVVPVRSGEGAGNAPAAIRQLGTPVADTKGTLASGYKVTTLPAVVVLKSRPVYHAAYSGTSMEAQPIEPVVDALVARDDLVPSTGACSGECGGGGGGCMAAQMANAGGCQAPK
jgi:hypothetical protein